jgi:1,2-phenylacetyl-CoA epoxidase PaaB subunit
METWNVFYYEDSRGGIPTRIECGTVEARDERDALSEAHDTYGEDDEIGYRLHVEKARED